MKKFPRRLWGPLSKWWLEILYPLALGLFLVGSFTYVLYSGQKHTRLASRGENFLLLISLKLEAMLAQPLQNHLVVVSADQADVELFGRARDSRFIDVSISGYANLVETLIPLQPAFVVLAWNPAAHEGQEDEYAPIMSALHRLEERTHVAIAIPDGERWTLPPEFAKSLRTFANRPCDDYAEVQLACPLNTDPTNHDDWIVQNIIDEITPDLSSVSVHHRVSMNIARTRPSFLLHLSDPNGLKILSFADVVTKPIQPELWHGKTVIIGSGLDQSEQVRTREKLGRVYTSFNSRSEPLARATPNHVFWAQIAEMFLNDRLVAVLPFTGTTTMALLFCAAITFILLRLGDVKALASFIGFALLSPVVNALAIRSFQVYIPLFDTLYFGLAVFLVSGFLSLGWEAFRRWRSREIRAWLDTTADLKSNFIALVSHNLNTPIAKMQGTLDLLLECRIPALEHARLEHAQVSVALLQITVKTILVNSAMESLRRPSGAQAFEVFQDCKSSSGSLLRRLGIGASWYCEEPMRGHLNLPFDLRTLHSTLTALLYATYHNRKTTFEVEFSLQREDSRLTPLWTILCNDYDAGALSAFMERLRTEQFASPFTERICFDLVRRMMQTQSFAVVALSREELQGFQVKLC